MKNSIKFLLFSLLKLKSLYIVCFLAGLVSCIKLIYFSRFMKIARDWRKQLLKKYMIVFLLIHHCLF